MALLYVEGHGNIDIDYGSAGEVLPEGALVYMEPGTGDVYKADAADQDFVSGISLNMESGATISKHEYDYDGDGPGPRDYQPASAKDSDAFFPDKDDAVPVGGQNEVNVLNPRTITDDTVTAPSIGHRNVVGVVDTSDANAPANAAGKIVEEGYTADADGDSTSTTFSRANSNFIALGRAEIKGDDVTGFGERVRVDTNAEY